MSTIPLKRIANIIAGQSPASDDVDPYDGGQPFLQGNAEFGALAPKPRWQCSVASKVARPGDVLLSVRAPVGAVNVADQRYGIGRGLCAVRPNSFAREYLWWYLQSQTAALRSVATGSTFEAVSAADVGSLSVPALAPEQMSAIASFLDRETAKIDALIDKQEQIIATLREVRATTITQAVTKGLDPNAAFADRGPDFPAIPAHWQVLPLKRVGQLVTGGTPAAEASTNFADTSDGLPWFRPEDLDTSGRPSNASKALSALGQAVVPLLPAPSIHVVSIGATLGKIGYVDVESSSNQQITAVVGTACPKYIYFALVASHERIWAASMGNTLPIISAGRLAAVRVPLPPIEEQVEIARHLDAHCGSIDALTGNSTEMIEALREYRSALITNAVTGKIDVREAV